MSHVHSDILARAVLVGCVGNGVADLVRDLLVNNNLGNAALILAIVVGVDALVRCELEILSNDEVIGLGARAVVKSFIACLARAGFFHGDTSRASNNGDLGRYLSVVKAALASVVSGVATTLLVWKSEGTSDAIILAEAIALLRCNLCFSVKRCNILAIAILLISSCGANEGIGNTASASTKLLGVIDILEACALLTQKGEIVSAEVNARRLSCHSLVLNLVVSFLNDDSLVGNVLRRVSSN